MRSIDQHEEAESAERLSLVIPLPRGCTLSERVLDDYRRVLGQVDSYRSVEVVISGVEDDRSAVFSLRELGAQGGRAADGITVVLAEDGSWTDLARKGLFAATGDHLMVLDVDRHYSPQSLLGVVEPVLNGSSDLAVAVPPRGRFQPISLQPLRSGFGAVSRMLLGSSDVFSGLFVVHRSLWERGGRALAASGPSLVLELLLRRPSRCVDVPVTVGPEFRTQRLGLRDVRSLKHVLDGRYGNLSRLIQFCVVGASGMVVDLSLYAFFQWLLSFTWLFSTKSKLFGVTQHLAIAAALSIGIALLWNFTLNRRLTFNDARGGSWLRQFFTYALSNALAIAFSFTVRLYLPAHVDFFGRHRLAAAVVGIVAATGISFSMSRWLVFSRRHEKKRATHVAGQTPVTQPSVLA
jgi:dolichol-phosphate mannosyltransferase